MRSYIPTIIVAAAIIVAVIIAGAAYKYRFHATETIVVTGLAEKEFTSDQIVWTGSFSRTGFDLKSAYASLKADEAEIKRYINSKGIPDSNLVFSSVDIQKNYSNDYDEGGRMKTAVFNGYTLMERITVDAKDITGVEKLSREITELLEKGIELNSSAPSYYYSKLNELKIDLLAKAATDAKLRAETIAKNSDSDLGNLKKANMGIFQITGKNSNEDYSYGGAFNTVAKEKKASITLRVEYQVK